MFTSVINAQTYTVTNGNSTGIGSLSYELQQAINAADAGNQVTLYLNVSTGLIPVIEPLPSIDYDNPNGSLTITKHPSAIMTQGLIADNTSSSQWNSLGSFGLIISNSNNITIENISFENFGVSTIFPSDVITILNSSNIKIQNCIFTNNDFSINAINSDLNCLGNNIFSTHMSLWWKDNQFIGDIGFSPTIILKNNNFSGYPINIGVASVTCENGYINSSHFEIKENLFNSTSALEVRNYVPLNQNINVQIENNSFQNIISVGLILLGPYKNNWVIKNNSFNMCNKAILTTYYATYSSNNTNSFGLDFVESNSLGILHSNTGNLIENCDISFQYTLSGSNSIVGYDVDGQIIINRFSPTSVRESLISIPINSPFSQTPIRLSNIYANINPYSPAGNNNFNAVLVGSANSNGTDLIFNYSINSPVSSYSPYVIEFFESNANGDLISLIGSDYQSTNGSYTKVFQNASVTNIGSRIGYTITSLSSTNPTGTSEVKYILITDTSIISFCDTCNSFKPKAGDYWMSAWVNVETGQQVKSYNSTNQSNTVNGSGNYSEVYIEFEFLGTSQTVQFYPTGEIIDGWQRVVGKFTIPIGTEDFIVHLVADNNSVTYFDDIRIHPFNASMKSYVYDGETFWLVSELDDNNYATFYEYDNEGGLIRIKKETSRGIVTIQETRSNTKKSN